MDAIITAGGITKENDPLFPFTHGRPKSTLLIAGRPMVTYVTQALAGIRNPGRILVYGLPDDFQADFKADVQRFPSQGGILQNYEHGLATLRAEGSRSEHVILTTGDIPLIQAPIIDAHLDACMQSDHDFYFTVIPKKIMQTRFPNCQRSFVRMKEGKFCGGDMHVLRLSQAIHNRELWLKLVETRKNALKQISMVGLGPLVKVASGQMTIAEGEQVFERVFKTRARAVLAPFPELGMDVDRPVHIQIVELDLRHRAQIEMLATAGA